jgi:hypothetical protein
MDERDYKAMNAELKNQTAVEWFDKELKNLIRQSELTDMSPSEFDEKENKLIKQAKEMEKQQIIDSYDEGQRNP